MRNASKELPGASGRYAPCGECAAQGALRLCCWTAPRQRPACLWIDQHVIPPKKGAQCMLLCKAEREMCGAGAG